MVGNSESERVCTPRNVSLGVADLNTSDSHDLTTDDMSHFSTVSLLKQSMINI